MMERCSTQRVSGTRPRSLGLLPRWCREELRWAGTSEEQRWVGTRKDLRWAGTRQGGWAPGSREREVKSRQAVSMEVYSRCPQRS